MKKREIKFRIWDDEDKKIYYFDKYCFNTEMFELGWECSNPPKLGFFGTRLSKTSVMMQYTGLKDKKEKEIYEGDILMVLGTVAWNNEFLSWYIWDDDGAGQSMDIEAVEYYEIIGNIYENPELLKKI